jgi:hypothetical protein
VTYWAGVGFGAVLDDFVCDLWCFLVCVVGVVDIEAPDFEVEPEVEDCVDEDEDDEVDVDGVGFAAVDEDDVDCCAATAMGRPSASAIPTSFFMTLSPIFAMPLAS